MAALDELISHVNAGFEKLGVSLRKATPARAIDRQVIEALYGVAYNALASHRLEQARSLFAYLCTQRPDESRFLAGLGQSLSALGEHAQAVALHSLAAHLSRDDPRHLLAMAESLIAMSQPEMAALALRAVDQATEGRDEQDGLKRRAGALSRLLKQAA